MSTNSHIKGRTYGKYFDIEPFQCNATVITSSVWARGANYLSWSRHVSMPKMPTTELLSKMTSLVTHCGNFHHDETYCDVINDDVIVLSVIVWSVILIGWSIAEIRFLSPNKKLLEQPVYYWVGSPSIIGSNVVGSQIWWEIFYIFLLGRCIIYHGVVQILLGLKYCVTIWYLNLWPMILGHWLWWWENDVSVGRLHGKWCKRYVLAACVTQCTGHVDRIDQKVRTKRLKRICTFSNQ